MFFHLVFGTPNDEAFNGPTELNAWSGKLLAKPAVPAPQPPAVAAMPALPPVTLPSGSCPAPVAQVKQSVNLLDGSGGAAIGAAKGGTPVQCVACDSRWCLIASNHPHATLPRQYLDFTYGQQAEEPAHQVVVPPIPVQQPGEAPQQAAKPPAKPVSQEPAAPHPADFGGPWFITSDRGVHFQLKLQQAAAGAGGSFYNEFGDLGQLDGQIYDHTLHLCADRRRRSDCCGQLHPEPRRQNDQRHLHADLAIPNPPRHPPELQPAGRLLERRARYRHDALARCRPRRRATA